MRRKTQAWSQITRQMVCPTKTCKAACMTFALQFTWPCNERYLSIQFTGRRLKRFQRLPFVIKKMSSKSCCSTYVARSKQYSSCSVGRFSRTLIKRRGLQLARKLPLPMTGRASANSQSRWANCSVVMTKSMLKMLCQKINLKTVKTTKMLKMTAVTKSTEDSPSFIKITRVEKMQR